VQGAFRGRVVGDSHPDQLSGVKRPLAAVALAVLTWSNATALQCAASALPAGERPPAQSHAHGGHGHGTPAPTPDADGHDHDGASHPGQTDCGLLMSCGAVLVAQVAYDATRVERLEGLPAPVLATPSTADVGLDTPPPRRSA
jgi:hypothetical protein